jgi:hypothetical protein
MRGRQPAGLAESVVIAQSSGELKPATVVIRSTTVDRDAVASISEAQPPSLRANP